MTVARGGRLPQAIDQAMEELNTSVDVDQALWREDIHEIDEEIERLRQDGR